MSFVEKTKSFFSKLWDWVSTEDSWLVFLNTQVKWAVGFYIRISTVILSITLSVVIALLIIKKSDIVSHMRSLVTYGVFGIENKGATVTSSPQIDYDKDLSSIDDVIKMLEERRKSNANAKENSATNK